MSFLDNYLTEDELIKLLKKKTRKGITKRTLRKWRQRRVGPPWTRAGKSILYHDDGCCEWLSAGLQYPVRARKRVIA
jgi:hypothetical protein